MKVRVGDNVKIITGKDKGKEGKIIRTFKKEDKVLVEGLNMIKRHHKPSQQNEQGGIVEREAPIHVSNVKVITSVKKEDKKDKKKVVKKETKKAKAGDANE